MQQIKLFFKDFSKLIAVHYRENWWAGLAAVGIFGIITIYKYINITIIYSEFGWNKECIKVFENNREFCTFLILAITTIYTLVCTLKKYSNKQRVHDGMMLPASQSAKFAADTLYSLVIIPFIMFATLFLADTVTSLICIHDEESFEFMDAVMGYPEYIYSTTSFLYSLLLFHSIATLWRVGNNHLISRLTVGTIILFFLLYDNAPSTYPFISSDCGRVTTEGLIVLIRTEVSWAPYELEKILSNLFYGTLPIMLYVISYFRLKEHSL